MSLSVMNLVSSTVVMDVSIPESHRNSQNIEAQVASLKKPDIAIDNVETRLLLAAVGLQFLQLSMNLLNIG